VDKLKRVRDEGLGCSSFNQNICINSCSGDIFGPDIIYIYIYI
jgi:hypothetical protein